MRNANFRNPKSEIRNQNPPFYFYFKNKEKIRSMKALIGKV